MSDLSLTEPITEAARRLFAAQMQIIRAYSEVAGNTADVTSVHEMRKAIRRSFTAFSLFEPYFQPDVLRPFQHSLRRIMKRLGRARDLAVLGQTLDQHLQLLAANQEDAGNLHLLRQYIRTQQTAAEARFQAHLQQAHVHDFFQAYGNFLQTPGEGVLPPSSCAPIQVRHLLPVLIYQRLAAVLAFADRIPPADALLPADPLPLATLPELHQLRLRAKELRYTLEFFAPLMGPTFTVAYDVVKRMLEHMGLQNDAYVAMQWLSRQNLEEATPAPGEVFDEGLCEGLAEGINSYRTLLQQQIDQLLAGFPPIWAEFDHPAWRINLALALPV